MKTKLKIICVLLALVLTGCAPGLSDDLPDEKGNLSESGASSSVQQESEAEMPFERTLYYTSLAVDGEDAAAALAAAEEYCAAESNCLVEEMSIDLNQTNFLLNRFFAEEYGAYENNEYEELLTPEYLEDNFFAVRAVKKYEFKDSEERGLYISAGGNTSLDENDCAELAYFVIRDKDGVWQVMGTSLCSYNAFDEFDDDTLKALFIDNVEVREYADRTTQKSKIDSDGEFAEQCTAAVAEAIKAKLESYTEVQSCEIIACEVDMDWTNRNIVAYWGKNYPNYMLAKDFLTVNTTLKLTLTDGYENTDFGKTYGPTDVDLSTEVVLYKTDSVIYDPYNILLWDEDTLSGWKRVDGFGYMNVAEE